MHAIPLGEPEPKLVVYHGKKTINQCWPVLVFYQEPPVPEKLEWLWFRFPKNNATWVWFWSSS
jgi:hypothetical protein